MKDLINKLNQYSYEYYTLGKPTISDDTYDALYDKLVSIEKETGVILSNSPTQKVGNIVLDKFKKVAHEYPLLSLDKTKEVKELHKFTNKKDCLLMLKLDGLTIDIEYKEGKLYKAVTRGNGEIGEDITHNVRTFTNVPLEIPITSNIHVVGEAIITYDIFNEINSKLAEDDKYKNPRNLVSGSVRQLDSEICKSRKVKFIAYGMNNTSIDIKDQQFRKLEDWGFDVVEWWSYCNKDRDVLEDMIENLKTKAEKLQIPIDGLVMTFRDIEYGKSLGRTSHHPLHSIAFKFADDVEFTNLIDIEWNVGRTGVITPVAIFEPVELDGAEVTRASLHNASTMKGLQLGIGDEISVYKANQIIPQVKDNLTKSNTLIPPVDCPCCGHKADTRTSIDPKTKEKIEKLICNNEDCNAKLIRKISHYCSRNAMNIEDLSEKTIEKFIELGILKSIADIYIIHKRRDKIINLDGFGVKSFNNLVESINKSKKCKLANFIFALGIPQVGLSTAKDLVKKYKTIDTLFRADKLSLMKIDGIGDVVAREIYMYFWNKHNREFIGYLANQELEFEDIKESSNKSLEGLIFVITGKVNIFKNRDAVKEKIESLGGKVTGSVTSKTNYLINNDISSTKGKNKTALELGINIISEEEFIKMCEN